MYEQIAERKSQLARLMATENITVEHRHVQTAGFDVKNRVLILPIWQNMDGFMYDLLTGHEVGHAIWTPAEGWHDAINPVGGRRKNFKLFLNVVEDARIEKKIKRKYPGLRLSFQRAYQSLFENDFFGVKGRDIDELPFIDRLNLYAKSQYTLNVHFSDYEWNLVKKAETTETWDDVVRVTEEIYGYSKQEQFETLKQDMIESESSGNDDFDYGDGDFSDEEDFDDSDDQNDSNSDQPGKNADPSKRGKENENSSQKADDGTDEESENESNGRILNRDKYSEPDYGADDFEPDCETDRNFRKNESKLIDETCRSYVYLDMPNPILENIVTPAKRVHELMNEHFDKMKKMGYFNDQMASSWVKEFKDNNEKYISLLVKEFEMKKAARSFSKSKLSDTGDIDISKLAGYKFDDNIFRKVMLTPKGKSHGLVLILDKSGSMAPNLPGSIEQILVLTAFCRKVNIPFVVYGFGDAVDARAIDLNTESYNHIVSKCFEKKSFTIDFSVVYLREYLNSNMNNVEYAKCVRNLILLKRAFEKKFTYPRSEGLSNTPLTQAIVAVGHLTKMFKKQNNLDIVNLVIVHDGDADSTYGYCHNSKDDLVRGFDFYKNNYIIRDKSIQFEYKMSREESMIKIVSNWFKKFAEAKIFGFYIIADSNGYSALARHYHFEQEPESYEHRRYLIKVKMKELKTQKFLISRTNNFNSMYFILGGSNLKTESEEIEIDGRLTSSKLKTAFMKFNKKKAVNRVLVSKFIDGIAVQGA